MKSLAKISFIPALLAVLCRTADCQQKIGFLTEQSPIEIEKVQSVGNTADSHLLMSLPGTFNGIITYAVSAYGERKGDGTNSLYVRRTQGNSFAYSFTKNRAGNLPISAPEINPAGKSLLFRIGLVEPSITNNPIATLDFEKNTVADVGFSGKEEGKVTSLVNSYFFQTWSPNERYLAFVNGGDIEGNTVRGSKPKLIVFDTLEKKYVVLTEAETAISSFSWKDNDTLIYGEQKLQTVDKQEKFSVNVVENHFRAREDKAKLQVEKSTFLSHAFRPVLSPDAKLVAFFAPRERDELMPQREGWQWISGGHFSLWVSDVDGSNAREINREQGTFPHINWMPDGKSC